MAEYRRTKVSGLAGLWRTVSGALRAVDNLVVCLWDAIARRTLKWSGTAWAVIKPSLTALLAFCVRLLSTFLRRSVPIGLWIAGKVPRSCVLGIGAMCSSCIASLVLRWGPSVLLVLVIDLMVEDTPALKQTSAPLLIPAIEKLAAICTFLCALAALAAFVRKRISLWILKTAASGFAVLAGMCLYLVWTLPGELTRADSTLFPSEARNSMVVHGTWRLAPVIALSLFSLFLLILRATGEFYGSVQSPSEPWLGDRILANLRTHGGDPSYRKSFYLSGFLHFFVIFILPFMLVWFGCPMKPYGVPKGTGTPVMEMVRVKKIKIKQPKKYVLSLNTPISFYVPKIEDSQVFEEVDKFTENVYEVQKNQKGSALGAGGPGSGGWPHGMEKSQVRFIRLEYDGGDWDQDMGYGSDYNMLLKFRELTKFNIASRTESVRIPQLLRFPKKRAPPFVYITGGLRGSIGVSQSECKVFRKYCLKMGGLIFADNGGGNFDQSFRTMMRRTFPELPLVEIPYDDVIFQQPFYFSAGAPPLWHHSGNQALGIRFKGRWIVFYHQGDINDAWKDGHSGASPNLADQAYKLGVNVICYAFNQYMQINYGDK